MPAVEPNIDNCQLIRVAYEVVVKAKANGLHRSVVLRLPVLIGTVPLKDERDLRRITSSYSSFDTDV